VGEPGHILKRCGDLALRIPEHWLLGRVPEVDRPQLFIMGLPRSGTTLVYQYLVHRLDVAYFTNGVGRFPHAAAVVTRWQRRRHSGYRSDFASEYGKVLGPVAPREAGSFWARFFGLDDYVRFADVHAHDIEVLRRTITRVQFDAGCKLFVNKNVKHMLRLDALAHIFPEARFLIVERDIVDVALSVLRGRIQAPQAPAGPQAWWSVRPPGIDRLIGLPVPEQIAGQLFALNERMNADLAHLPRQRVLRVRYEDFCSRPESLIELTCEQFGPLGFRNALVECFAHSTNHPQTPEEEALVRIVRGNRTT